MKRLLLTSFDIWLPHHKSNSSDDLLEEVTRLNNLPLALTTVRKLPVDVYERSRRGIGSHLAFLHLEPTPSIRKTSHKNTCYLGF